MSARQEDLNGYIEIKGNPLSKVGVFPYLGVQIDSSLVPDKIYNVYRPEDELSDPECLNSFKLIPFTDDHAMLGSSEDGLMPAEKKGVHGTTGQDIYFEFPYLKGNLKVFSESLAGEIEDGKQELSIGYRCKYEPQSGVYDGTPYDFVQRTIRGNHVALVDEGRSGPDVKVLDHFKFTLDSGVIKMEETEVNSVDDVEATPTLQSLSDKIEELKVLIAGIVKSENKASDDKPANPYAENSESKDESPDDDDDSDASDKKSGMDSKDFEQAVIEASKMIVKKDALAKKISNVVGTFAHDSMSLKQVAEYGVKKLGLKCHQGHEESALTGYFAAAKHTTVSNISEVGMDSYEAGQLDKYLQDGARI